MERRDGGERLGHGLDFRQNSGISGAGEGDSSAGRPRSKGESWVMQKLENVGVSARLVIMQDLELGEAREPAGTGLKVGVFIVRVLLLFVSYSAPGATYSVETGMLRMYISANNSL